MEANVPADEASSCDSNDRNSLRLKELLRVLSDSAVISPEQMGEIWNTDIGDSFDKNGSRIKSLLGVLLEAGMISETDMEAIWAGETPTKTSFTKDSGCESGSQTEVVHRGHDDRSRSPHRTVWGVRAQGNAARSATIAQQLQPTLLAEGLAQSRDDFYQPKNCQDLPPPEESEIPRTLQKAENAGLPDPPDPVRIAYQSKNTKTFYLWCSSCSMWIAHLNFSAQAGKCEGCFGRCPHFDGPAYEAMLLRKAHGC